MRKRNLEAGLLVFLIVLACRPGVAQPASEVVSIDVDAKPRPFPHFWEQMFGSGHANLTMRESWRDDLHATRAITDFRYVRFHDIFHDQNGVYSEAADGKPVYNWSYVDQIYDGLLANGVRPFVELSFMPAALAASQKPHPFWYKPLPNPPRSYEKWGKLIETFARHLEDRYGADEVRQWYFEVWNEPNIDFWTGKPAQSTYFELYAAAAKALKVVDRRYAWAARRRRRRRGLETLSSTAARTISLSILYPPMSMATTPPRTSSTWTKTISRAEMVARAAQKGVRPGQSLAATGAADHLVRI